MRVGLVVPVLLMAVATLHAHVQAASQAPRTGWVGNVLRRRPLEAHEKSGPPSAQSEDELRAEALARRRGQNVARMTTDGKEGEVGGEIFTTQAKALRLLSVRENSLRWFAQSKREKVLGIFMAAHVAAAWGYGSNRTRLILVLRPLVAEPLIAQALVVMKKRKMASGVVSTHGTRGHISRLPSATPKSTDDPFSSQPCTNSMQGRGWFGWHTTPPAAGSRGNAIVVASEATLQDESERKKIQVHPRDDSVEENAVGEEEPARGNRALLLKLIRERMNAKLLRSYQTAAVGRFVRGYPFTYHWSQG